MNKLIHKTTKATAYQTLMLVTCVLLVALSGCATQSKATFKFIDPLDNKVWPDQPDVPRYQYVGQILGEQNFTTIDPQGFKQKLINALKWIVGLFSEKYEPIVLQRPQMGMIGDDGRMYVTDVSRQAVYVFDPVAGRLDVWEWAEQNRRFSSPIGIAPGPNGEILVSDSQLKTIFRLNARGEPIGSFGEGIVKRPTGLARDAENERVFVADSSADNIKVFSDQGELLDVIGASGENVGEFNGPAYLAYARGKLYVTDVLNSRIQVLNTEGDYLKGFGRRGLFVGDIPHPKGVGVDNDDNIYVIESLYDHLLVYNAEGELLLPLGGTGKEIGQFYLPAGVWVDKNDRIYVADMFNGRVVVFQYLGGVSN